MPFLVTGAVDALDVWASAAGGESFASGDDGPPVWRAVLVSDASLAAADLDQAEARLNAARLGLEQAEGRLATAALDKLNLLGGLRQPRPEASASLWSGLAQLHLESTVETELGGQLVARTRLGWAAGEQTVWRVACTTPQADLHRRTVSLAMESRLALVRRLSLGLRYAARVAATLALPGGPLLALPSVLRYIDSARR